LAKINSTPQINYTNNYVYNIHYLLKMLVVAIPAQEKGKCMALRDGRLSEK
jgi:hypothetical protein